MITASSCRKIITFFVLFFPLLAGSQDIRFDRLSVDKGLSQGNVWAIHQDKLGFIWIGTEDGLNLYDGYSVKIFRNNPNDTFSISNNNIHCLAEDQNGNLWIGTQSGLNYYNRSLNRFERFLNNPNDEESISHSDVGVIYFDSKNNLWAGTTSRGLNLFNPETKKFKRYLHEDSDSKSIADNFIKDIVEDHNKQLWVATMGGLSLMTSDGFFTNYHHDPEKPNSLSSNKTTTIFEDKSHNLWIGTFDAGANMMPSGGGSVTRYPHNPNDPTSIGADYIYNINESPEGELWFASDGALCRFDKNSGTFARYTNDQTNEESLSSNIVSCVYFDVNGRMWVGTRFGGVNIYDKNKYAFQHFKHNANSLSGNTVTCFQEDDKGNFWVGMDGGGLNYYDRATGKFTALAHRNNDKNSPTNDKVLALKRDHLGDIWIGMWGGGISRYNPETKKFTHYRHDTENPKSISDDNIFHIMEDSKGNVWIATWGNGVSRYNRETNDFTQFVHDPNDPGSIYSGSSPIVYLMEDHLGKIWMATEQDGLKMFDPGTNRFTHYRTNNQPGSITENAVFALYEDKRDRLWVGTNGGGLCLFDGESKKFKAFRAVDGLPNDAIMGILEDDSSNLWISTNKGICKFNPDKASFKNYNESDGLQGNQFVRWAFTKLATGELLFGGTNGFNLFNPPNIKDNPYVPPVYITDFRLFNKEVVIGEDELLTKNILLTEEITLKYTQNFISFEFTALNYRQSEKNQYKYIMEGFQDEWIEAGSERKVSYTNLSPGDYTFRVIGSNNDGVWNEKGAAIHITIVPPFWKTIWFTSLIVILIISGAVYFVRYQRGKVKTQKAELQAIIDAKTNEVKKKTDEIIEQREQEKVRNWITEGLAHFGDIISKHKGSLDDLSKEVLNNLVKYVGAYQGIMAVADRDDPTDIHLKITATYAVSAERVGTGRIELDEGLIGATFQDKELRYVENVPTNYIKIESGLGEAVPSKLLLLPLKTEDGAVHGVVELAFLTDVEESIKVFMDKVSSVIALNIHAASLNQKTTLLLQQSKEQTEELRAQEEEMRQNMEELEATQEQISRQMNELNELKESLEKEKYLFNALMDNLPDAIYFKDRQSKFIRVSKYLADHFGASVDALIGKSDFDFQDEAHANLAFEDEKNIMRTRTPKIDFVEKEVINGEEHWVSTTKMPLVNSRGEVMGTFGVSSDVTKMKKLEKDFLLKDEILKKEEQEYEAKIKRLEETIKAKETEIAQLKKK